MLICPKSIFYFFKVIHFNTKKKFVYKKIDTKNINLPKLANKLKYKIDLGICTERLIAIAYE